MENLAQITSKIIPTFTGKLIGEFSMIFQVLVVGTSLCSFDDDFLANLNPESLKVVQAVIEPALAQAQPEDRFQFEREGYFVADQHDHQAEKPVFNRILDLKDSFKVEKK